MTDFRKICKFFAPNFCLTQICLFWHNSRKNDENKKFRKNQNFDPPNFCTPLNFSVLIDLVTLHLCTKFGVSSSKLRHRAGDTKFGTEVQAICFEPLSFVFHLFRLVMVIEAGDVTHRRLGQNRNEDRFSKNFEVFYTNFFFTHICLFWHNSPRNDENKNFRKNQNFDPLIFGPP